VVVLLVVQVRNLLLYAGFKLDMSPASAVTELLQTPTRSDTHTIDISWVTVCPYGAPTLDTPAHTMSVQIGREGRTVVLEVDSLVRERAAAAVAEAGQLKVGRSMSCWRTPSHQYRTCCVLSGSFLPYRYYVMLLQQH
jgi:hypothetical protein